jgi:nucleoside-diphosphate-sugar epimerase
MIATSETKPHKPVISILGCGWLGLPLAQYLIGKGYTVKGSRTSQQGVLQLRQQGIEGYQVSLGKEVITGEQDFWQADILIINIPPSRQSPDEHLQEIQTLAAVLGQSDVKHVLFISSTSVYADTNGVVTEENNETPEKGSGRVLRAVESLLMQQAFFTTTVLRPGGLIGYDRLPLSAASITARVRNWDAPMNVVHRDDVIEIVYTIIEKQAWGEIFNACMDEHPTRREYYLAAAKALGFEIEQPAAGDTTPYKIVSSEKLKSRLSYRFIYSDPLHVFSASI